MTAGQSVRQISEIFFLILLPSGAALSYLGRKLRADLQARIGPQHCGWRGVCQPIADFIKMLQKSDPPPAGFAERILLHLYTMAMYSTLAVFPLSGAYLLVDTELSALLPFWVATLLAVLSLLLGFQQNRMVDWLGALQLAAQMSAATFASLLSLMTAAERAGSFRWSALAGCQGFAPWHWTAFSNPFQALAALIFMVSGLALWGIRPLEVSLTRADLGAAVGLRLSGRALCLYFWGRFTVFFLWAVMTVVLFFGAWKLPWLGANRDVMAFSAWDLLGLAVVLIKAIALMALLVWVGQANPRGRMDQVAHFNWRILSPLALCALVGAGFWEGGGSFFD